MWKGGTLERGVPEFGGEALGGGCVWGLGPRGGGRLRG